MRTAFLLPALLLLSFTAPAPAQTGDSDDAPSASASGNIQVQDQRLTIRFGDRTFDLAAREFRPAGNGPFPLVVINHGTPVSMRDARSMKLGFNRGARWFASQGYAVVVALRPGFGDSDGPYLEKTSISCEDRDYYRDGLATAAVEAAIVESAAALPGVDPQHILVIGQSAGGFGAIALGDAPPPGVVGVINFAGGRGGDDHEHICSGESKLVEAAGAFGKANRVPQIWLYAANDHFFPPPVAHAMFQAFQSQSIPPVRFVDLPPFDDDGHKTFAQADASVWAPALSDFLAGTVKPAAPAH